MKKLVFFVILSSVLAVVLVALAFFYLHVSGHKRFVYTVYSAGREAGTVRVDRYVTEGKVIYKSSASYPGLLGYPGVSEKLFLSKKTMTPLKYVEKAEGTKGQKRLLLLDQDGERSDLLFLEHPKFFALKGFKTGEKTLLFDPVDIMLYMPVFEKYNYWKKGAQFFEIMIPIAETLPPMRDKLEVRYLEDEYITVMGRKVEAESFLLDARSLPGIRVSAAKYSHRLLTVRVEAWKTELVLTSYVESPEKRIQYLAERIKKVFRKMSGGEEVLPGAEEDVPPVVRGEDAAAVEKENKKEFVEIFFESGNLVLRGRLWFPEGKGPFPAVVFVSDDGPRPMGEQLFIDSFGKALSESGFLVMDFDSPGQGKSQGDFRSLNDAERGQNITDAVRYLEKRPDVLEGGISLAGYHGGGYLALKTAESVPSVRSCIMIGTPLVFEKAALSEDVPRQSVRILLNKHRFGAFDDGFMKTVAENVRDHFAEVTRSTRDISYFMGVRLPYGEYAAVMERDPYSVLRGYGGPVLIILGRDEPFFMPQTVDEIKQAFKPGNREAKVAVFREIGEYVGQAGTTEDGLSYEANGDVLHLIEKWLEVNGMPEKEETPPTPSGGYDPAGGTDA